ncbi:AraC family transcriptional regulator [Paenibacillus silvisoli]|uniref:AraC family transcriptional regulator n=1 Tax=Paenibacillus silvisoli TaxID=3110539 RepID=UPI002806364A|nr:AraC family transcriptional regulator [Paenibacillus silvisoli]
MKPVRIDAQPEFPFALTYRDTKPPQRELPDHLHDWYELVYVHSGKGSFFIDRTIYDMRAGDLFILPGSTIHRAFPDKDEPVTSTALFLSPILVEQPSLGEAFSYLQCFEQSRASRSFKLECPPELQSRIELCLDEMETELRLGRIGYRHAVVLLTEQLLLAVNREKSGELRPKSLSSFSGPAWMRDILLYIDHRFTEDIGLGSLCARAAVSPAHFSRVFKQLTGMNVTGFIAAKRIIRAKELLLETDDSIATIAAACGFESMPHFHRVFKGIVGLTPAAFRQQAE